MTDFLDVPLSLEAMLDGLDGTRAPRLWCLYSVLECFRGHIERFYNNNSRPPPDFPSAVEIHMLETREIQGLSKTRYIANYIVEAREWPCTSTHTRRMVPECAAAVHTHS